MKEPLSFDELTPGRTRTRKQREFRMQDAKYFRAQAHFCLEMARQMSDRQAAESLQEKAAQYHQRATDLERAQTEESDERSRAKRSSR